MELQETPKEIPLPLKEPEPEDIKPLESPQKPKLSRKSKTYVPAAKLLQQ